MNPKLGKSLKAKSRPEPTGDKGASLMTAKNASAPGRTCLGCRQVKDQKDLRRLVLVGGGDEKVKVVWDDGRKLGGRGAWICRDHDDCLALSIKRRSFNRAFRVQVYIEPPDGLLYEEI